MALSIASTYSKCRTILEVELLGAQTPETDKFQTLLFQRKARTHTNRRGSDHEMSWLSRVKLRGDAIPNRLACGDVGVVAAYRAAVPIGGDRAGVHVGALCA